MKLKIYTGQIQKTAHYQALDYTTVSILKAIPAKYRADIEHEISELGQSWAAKDKTKQQQTELYRRILEKQNPRKIFAKLKELHIESKGIILMSWENPGEFSHRQLAAKWLQKYTGIKIVELNLVPKIKIDITELEDN